MSNSDTRTLLSRTSHFAPTPTVCSHADIRRGIHDLIRKVQWSAVLPGDFRPCRFVPKSTTFPPEKMVDVDVRRMCDRVRGATDSILRSCKNCFGSDNLTIRERVELNRLRNDSSIIIKPADKGGKWVVMPSSKYDAEAFRQLSNRDIYQLTDRDFTLSTSQRLTRLLQHLKDNKFITGRELKALLPPKDPRPRMFYLLPKVHKDVWPDPEMPPGRPIVSDVGSVSRPCASLIDHFLSPIAQSLPSFVRDSSHAIAIFNSVVTTERTLLFTIDIVSLYTNVPIEEGLEAVATAFLQHPDIKRPDLTILTMLRLLLTSNDFYFKGQHYIQLKGTAMGSAYGASFANVFMGEWEKKVSDAAVKPSLWVRYIDDIFGIWEHGLNELLLFKDFLNAIHPNIKVELKFHEQHIRFLDLEVYKCDNSLSHRIGFKSTDSHLVLPPSSHHPSHVFKGIVYGQMLRWATKSSTYSDFVNTKRTVTPIWREQGYTRSLIRSTTKQVLNNLGRSEFSWTPGFVSCDCNICKFSTSNNSISDFSTKNIYLICHRITCKDTCVIYVITCKNCNSRYVGETSRSLRRRISEHLKDIEHHRDTAVSRHFTTDCSVNHFSFTAIERVFIESRRRKKENVWMNRLHSLTPSGMNICQSSSDRHFAVLPNSSCARRIASVCRREVNATPSFTAARNLGTLII